MQIIYIEFSISEYKCSPTLLSGQRTMSSHCTDTPLTWISSWWWMCWRWWLQLISACGLLIQLLHFKLNNTSQLAMTVEKNVSEVALRNFHFFLKSCFFQIWRASLRFLTFKVVQRLKSFPLCYHAFKSMWTT